MWPRNCLKPKLVGNFKTAERKSRAGRKPMDAVLMFKTLMLSALYNLSDCRLLLLKSLTI